ncbi:hypothetical protein LWC34_43320 [Kibdelosporangium philippinense]|uniref:Uncharacterized protein n=1 Tax=Kibdelosporangium philippinense TaxID=211113 RepID=A0ABS8ZPT8_9PSEU|nr:hypothetical protein [Kibdelosporangium philippinense]MCE7009594.1 hypothetical protein [Kibdelosporangium philippinense]
MGIRVLIRGAVLTAVAAGSLVTMQTVSAAEACAAEATVQGCTPAKKQEEGFSTKRSCDWAGSSGAQAGRWTKWNCSRALGGYELWVQTCTARSASEVAAVRD